MRKITVMNEKWTFQLPGKAPEVVDVPHTWNGTDGQDGGNDYLRCKGTYTKTFEKPVMKEGETCLLIFHGVNSEADVTVNGTHLCRHEGGYSTFTVDITEHLKDNNIVEVVADNTPNNTVYPQKADFTFYGGMYRDVIMEVLPKNHFAYGKDSAPALKLKPVVDGKDGIVYVEANVKGEGQVKLSVIDREGSVVATGDLQHPMKVENIHLWNGLIDPYLYTVKAELVVNGIVEDETTSNIGFRTFSVDPEKGFFLNGKPYPLRGVCRHQDRPGIGNAISIADHDEDLELILEVGANTVRLSHYQHDQYFYDLCDKAGLVVWAEIPYISKHLTTANENAMSQMAELIHQNYNHPSIVCWCVSNEITMSYAGKECVDCHDVLNDYCHKEDPDRLTVIACYMPMRVRHKVAKTVDLVSYNLYFGWYLPFTALAGWKLDNFRKKHPSIPLGLSEYGAEAMPNLHSERPRRGDNTEEYQCIYHEGMLKVINNRDYLWATHIWNMFDFAADARNQGGEPGMNHKGLVTFDRKTKKDSFYLYKAFWSEEAFVHLCGKRFVNRTGKKTKVKVYSNQPEVTLYNNGKLIGTKKGDKIFTFTVNLEEKNNLEVKAGNLTDSSVVLKVAKKDPSYKMKKGGSNKSWEK